ncbi:hypothetical protein ROLI_036910 [Roseobacter fucihabitans]|uniref:TRAP transporter small permease protein n=1 Tax=Roseobacter fucihabitans TaxID=1537242 RepID=A0ABZ2BXX4_9RHOB|nr:TRAP transporter small permease [Roseobacter litoralis]MBC6966344.1 Tripartite ATP-independent periplasmic transporter, DctQ component [Roseobacter litoralis]
MIHRAIRTLAQATAIMGGLVLVALILLMTLSIIGRSLNKLLHSDLAAQWIAGPSQWLLDLGIGEVQGSYELLEAGVAFAIFSFFPICQLYGAHATVDIFTSRLPARLNRGIVAFWEVVLTAALILISWRLYEGMQRYIGNGETTFFLQFPVWWSYSASFVASVVICIVALYCAVMRVGESLSGRALLPTA